MAERGRHRAGRLQRRDLQLPGAARGARSRAATASARRATPRSIVHLYEEKGADCIADLDGMFAIAIWDERAGRLTLARDRAGKKPLFYYRDDRLLAFASEIKAFFGHPRHSRSSPIRRRCRTTSSTATCRCRRRSTGACRQLEPGTRDDGRRGRPIARRAATGSCAIPKPGRCGRSRARRRRPACASG